MKDHAVMNRIYRIVWNAALGAWQVVAETARRHGKGGRQKAVRRAIAGGTFIFLSVYGHAAPLPTGGELTAGQGGISQAGNTLTINQSTPKMAIDWQSFSIGQGNTVNFVQPSASSIALNRVLGPDPSQIQGALNANGRVFLLNPNGVLFGSTAQVNVGGLVASTLTLSNADFLDGNYRFSGESSNAIINHGNITATGDNGKGGTIALIAARISNAGTLTATSGEVLLGAGSEVVLDMGGPVKLAVEKGAVDALIENGGAIHASGGNVLLTAKAAGALASTVINTDGLIEAQTLATGERGQILLLGGMENDRIEVRGTLDASAPHGGDGGFIETSAAQVETKAGLNINAGAAYGNGGEWLIDPYDYIINATAAGNIVSALNTGTSVTVTTAVSNSGYGAQATTNGDITVASAINKTAGGDATLRLLADRSIIVNSDIGATASKLNLTLSAANKAGAIVGGVNINGNINTNGGNILIGGANGTSTNGIGYALNLDASNAAVVVQQNKSIQSGGGNITLNGKSLVGSSSGNYSGVKGGVYIMSGASILSGSGNINITGESTAGTKTFGFGVEASSNTLTTIGTSAAGGHLTINGVNSTAGATDADRAAGALGMVNNGSYDRLVYLAPSVADLLVKVNGSIQSTTYTYSPPNSGCSAQYPNCGYLQVPGNNNSYLYAAYKVVNMATKAIYVTTGDGSKVYDGTMTATGLGVSASGGPLGFSLDQLGSLTFATSSKNAGTYTQLITTGNPGTYTSGGTSYAVSYYTEGTYTISPKTLTATAQNKVYDGTTAASVTANGIVGGDDLVFNYTSGAFASKDAGTGIGVSVTGITLSGLDAGNYQLVGGTTLNTTADITARTLSVSGSRTYDGSTVASSGILSLGNLVDGEDLLLNGAGSVADKNAGTAKTLAFGSLALADGVSGKASNYQLGTGTIDITKANLTVSGLSAQDKTYDGTTAATLAGTASLAGIIDSDTVSVDGSAPMTGTFADKNAGENKAVSASLSGIALTGTDAGNYQINGFASPLTASISNANLTVSGISAQDKTYDGTTAATLIGTAALAGIIGADTVTLSGAAPTAGTFADKNAGENKAVSASLAALGLTGTDAGNYQINGFAAPLTASINKANLTVSGISAQDKTYDGTTAATLIGTAALAGIIGADTVTLSGAAPTAGTFADKNAGENKAVSASLAALGLTGTDAGNYQINGFASPLSASINKANLTVSGLSAQDKNYDGTTAATLAGTAALSGVIGADTVTLSGAAPTAGTFADKNAGDNKSVSASLSGIALTGTDAGNYQINGFASPLTASITQRTVTLSAMKNYDGTNALAGFVSLGNLVAGETLGYAGAFSNDPNPSTAGKYIATIALINGAGGLASNYQLPDLNAITAPVTITGQRVDDTPKPPVASNPAVTSAQNATVVTTTAPSIGVNNLVYTPVTDTLSTATTASSPNGSGASTPSSSQPSAETGTETQSSPSSLTDGNAGPTAKTTQVLVVSGGINVAEAAENE